MLDHMNTKSFAHTSLKTKQKKDLLGKNIYNLYHRQIVNF